MSVMISDAIRNTICNVIVDAVDAGAGNGYIQFRTGDPPAATEDANSGTLLVSHTFAKPAFTAAGSAGFQPTGRAAMLGTGSQDTIVASGTVGHFRAFDSNNVCVMQGRAGPDVDNPDVSIASDLETATSDFQSGGTITIQSLWVLVPAT